MEDCLFTMIINTFAPSYLKYIIILDVSSRRSKGSESLPDYFYKKTFARLCDTLTAHFNAFTQLHYIITYTSSNIIYLNSVTSNWIKYPVFFASMSQLSLAIGNKLRQALEARIRLNQAKTSPKMILFWRPIQCLSRTKHSRRNILKVNADLNLPYDFTAQTAAKDFP